MCSFDYGLTGGGLGDAYNVFHTPQIEELLHFLRYTPESIIYFYFLGVPRDEKACRKCLMLSLDFSPLCAVANITREKVPIEICIY